MRYLEQQEKTRTLPLWREAFPEDSEEFLEYYYTEKTADNRILAEEEEGRIVSMLHRNPYPVWAGSRRWNSDYVVAVATARDRRGRGLMRRLLACLSDRHAQQTQLARLETVTDQQKAEMGPLLERVRLLTPGDIPALYDLYMKIEEFAYNYRGKTREACYEDIRMNVSVLGRTYGIFEGERLACAAQTSAESPLSAMIVGVATDPDFRGRGYAKASVLKLCADCLEEGRQFVCLFFDNPDAGRIYHSIGFTDVGAYTMLRSGE